MKNLTESALVNSFFFDSVEKIIKIYMKSLDNVVEKGLIAEAFVLIQYVNFIFELSDRHFMVLKYEHHEVSIFLIDLRLELRLKSNLFI